MSVGLMVLVALANPQAALEAAIRCYDDLDYACAEERLAEALAGGLEGSARERARLYEALLATAFRDEPRARRAVRALLGIAPPYDPGPRVPPKLRALFEALRPAPVPPPAPLARADFTSVQLLGRDAEQWTLGLGAEAGGGVLLFGWLTLEGALGYSNHAPATFVFEGLDLLYGHVGVGGRTLLGPLRVGGGAAIGSARAAADHGVLGADAFWGATLGLPISVSWPLWRGFGVGVSGRPSVFVTSRSDQFAASFFLPLTVGVRYGN